MFQRIDSDQSRFSKVLFASLFFFCWLFSAGSAMADGYGAEGNPTGNPIGGGTGYGNILTAASANYVVTDKAGLLSALSSAVSGQVIYIDDNARIDISDVKGVKILPGVTLASGRGRNGSEGALLYETGYGTTTYHFWIGSGGTAARVTGLRLIGADMEIGDQEGPYIYSTCLHCGTSSLEVDNCELAGWGSSAVSIAPGGHAYVHHNYIHHNRRNGLGYGVDVGSAAVNPNNALVEANLFDAGRHYVASHGTPGNSYTARYNICLEHEFSHAFDMHGGTDRGDGTTIAGDSVTIYCNTFRDSDETGICIRGVPRYLSPIYNNWFYHASATASPSPISQINATGNLDIHDNVYGTTPPAGTTLPVALSQVDCASGTAPLTVHFDGAASYASAGSIVDYQWFLGDSSTTIGSTAKGAQASYTFNDPGTYDVVLQVRDSNGVPARSKIPVTVCPSTSGCLLSFWVKDSYRGSATTGAYVKEALIDGNVVWSSDVAGDDGWVHVVKDVSAQVAGKSQVTLMLRTRCATGRTSAGTIKILYTYWDDVALFGFDTKNGGFEAPVSNADWTFSENGSGWDGRRYTGDLRSGYAGYRICYLSNTCSAGSSGQICQTLSNPDPAPSVNYNAPQGSAVAVSTAIAVGFSKAMDQGSAQTAFSITPAVAGNFSWSGMTMTFTPSASLQGSTVYTVTIGTGAADLAGNSMSAKYSWTFTTADTMPPSVLTEAPQGSAVTVSAAIVVGFSEAMNQGSAQMAFSVSPSASGSFSWNGTTMTYTPSAALQGSTTYTVTIGTGATDLAGNGLPAKCNWSFTTAAVPVVTPAIVSKSPQGSGASVNATITVGFNEAMNESSVQSAFSISPAVSGIFSWAGNTMTFKPSEVLRSKRTYTVTVSAGAKDLAGNSMAAACTWQFTTQASSRKSAFAGIIDGAPVSGTISVKAVIDDYDNVARVDYYLDDVLLKTITASPFVWNWDSGSASAGNHTLRINIVGADGVNCQESITVKVVKAGREEVYPAPYVKGKSTGGEKITIGNLPASCTVRIYTMAGDLVNTLHHDQGTAGGREEWDISGVPGGIYLYSITGDGVPSRNGKIAIVK